MKRTVWVLLLAGLLGSGAPVLADETTATFAVEKMTCATCPLTVRIAMKRVDGVRDVKVDFDSKTATVIFDDSRTSVEKIAEASTNVGFPATPNGA
ncbi:MAG TPA: cation transporter [Woeseiaceae bacterium]|nr:cation transporter [Woeseiaceae bacterium]